MIVGFTDFNYPVPVPHVETTGPAWLDGLKSAALLAGSGAVALGVLSACSVSVHGSTNLESTASPVTVEDASAGTSAAPQTNMETSAAEAATAELEITDLTEDQMMDVLLTSSDLVNPPEGHSTDTGLAYFEEKIAVNPGVYTEIFGPNACARQMDEINLNLVGEGALTGVLHEYRRTGADGSPELLFVWMLSYPRDVDTSSTWEKLLAACEGQGLRNDTEQITISALDHEPFSGVNMQFLSEVEAESGVTQGQSASAAFGQNLVMMSAINMEDRDFAVLMDRQAEKITELEASLGQQPQG